MHDPGWRFFPAARPIQKPCQDDFKILAVLLGSDHGRTPPIGELAQKQGRFSALGCPFYPQKDVFKP
jgi:hypothetical protein